MSKKLVEEIESIEPGEVEVIEVHDVLRDNYMPYTMSVIKSRALPEIDGFKPSHRKLLFAMYGLGLGKSGSKRTKSTKVVSQTMMYNPHGDTAVYDTMVRMTEANESLLLPFVDGKGNYGKVYSDSMPAAAYRYTEARLAPISNEVFKDINKNVVDFVPNYDGTLEEPELLPVTFPTILANPLKGIAVGMASNILPYNLVELTELTAALVNETITNRRKKISTEDALEIMPGPDFPTGGEVVNNKAVMASIYETGKGTVRIRAKWRYIKDENIIEIYEIPYTTTVEKIVDSIIKLVSEDKITELRDVRNETDFDGLKIALELKRGVDPDVLMDKLLLQTPLESTASANYNILIDGKPRVMGIREIIMEWMEFRISCIERQIEYDLEKAKDRLHLLRGLEKVLIDLDKAVDIVKRTRKDKNVIKNLMKEFKIDEVQAEYVGNIKLRNFNREYFNNRIKDIKDLEKEIKELEKSRDEKSIKERIVKEQKEIGKKYGKERQTDLISKEEAVIEEEEVMIEDYNLKVFVTKEGYLKKIPLVSLRGASKQNLKQGDSIVGEWEGTNLSEIIFFTDKHNAYKLNAHEIEDCKASELGEYIPNLIDLEDGEEVLYVVVTSDFSGNMVYIFEDGKAAKVDMKNYETKTNRRQLKNVYNKSSKLVRMYYEYEDESKAFYAISSIDKCLLCDISKFRINTYSQSAGNMYMRGAKADKDFKVVDIVLVDEVEFKDPEYYKANVPAVGKYLTDDDLEEYKELRGN